MITKPDLLFIVANNAITAYCYCLQLIDYDNNDCDKRDLQEKCLENIYTHVRFVH